jgi:broad specificity phosphatase PhoE
VNELVLARHGETEWSANGRHTSRTDLPLTGNGRRLAQRLAPLLAERRFALVLTSPLRRAVETCELAGLGAKAQVRDQLGEWDYGDYEGITTPDIRAERPGWYLWRDGVPNGESADEVAARCDRVIEELVAAPGDVAVFAHGHVLRALSARWVEQPVAFGGRLYLATGSLSVLGFEREVRVIRSWNLE